MFVHCYKLASSLVTAAMAAVLLLWSMSDVSAAQSARSAQLTEDGASIELSSICAAGEASHDADALFGSANCSSSWHCSTSPLAITNSCKLPVPSKRVLLPPIEWIFTLAADAALILDPPR
jgi:hypothetical protein